MSVRDTRREAAIERMVDHVLAHGLAGASLRPLAKAAGTSDRMLLYYFADKDELIAAVLERLAARLTPILEGALPEGARVSPDALFATVVPAMRSLGLEPFMRVWLELAAGASAGNAVYARIGGAIAGGFHAWIADHLAIDDPAVRAAAAARLLGAADGLLLLDALGRADLADLAVEAAAA
jgi:AcrR family transcriptional regulator